jgi:hypothetical protein
MHAATNHISEVAEILALGLMRLLEKKSSELSPPAGETSLDFNGHRSGHPTPTEGRKSDE